MSSDAVVGPQGQHLRPPRPRRARRPGLQPVRRESRPAKRSVRRRTSPPAMGNKLHQRRMAAAATAASREVRATPGHRPHRPRASGRSRSPRRRSPCGRSPSPARRCGGVVRSSARIASSSDRRSTRSTMSAARSSAASSARRQRGDARGAGANVAMDAWHCLDDESTVPANCREVAIVVNSTPHVAVQVVRDLQVPVGSGVHAFRRLSAPRPLMYPERATPA